MKIDTDKLPRHIAIIMDGNGRWAKQHAIGRISGHKKGAQAVRKVRCEIPGLNPGAAFETSYLEFS